MGLTALEMINTTTVSPILIFRCRTMETMYSDFSDTSLKIEPTLVGNVEHPFFQIHALFCEEHNIGDL
jgi:hypothetical protein